jgi:hypothetical protein
MLENQLKLKLRNLVDLLEPQVLSMEEQDLVLDHLHLLVVPLVELKKMEEE